VIRGVFGDDDIERLRVAVHGYTVDAVDDLIGPIGRAALSRADLAGVARAVPDDGPLATLVRLFLLGAEVSEHAARAALRPLPLEQAIAAGVLELSAQTVRALVDVRPHARQARAGDTAATNWWVVSDFGSDVRAGPLPTDHVLGIGAASLTLAQATPRTPVGRALDLGTGCGVQALHLGTHAQHVVATDVSDRALRFAATTAALSGQAWDLRSGSLFEPVTGERFDLVVANPPFVVSPGDGGYDYRDSGSAGDGVSEALVRGLPAVLADGGVGQLLANWIVPTDRPWQDRLADWLAGSGCDAWVWQREVADPGEYAAMWLRDAGEVPGSRRWGRRYNAWLDWFAAHGVAAIGMGLITLWRAGAQDPVVVMEDVPQPVEQPIGHSLPGWHDRQRWLADLSDTELLAAFLTPAADLVLDRSELVGPDGWRPAVTRLRQSHDMRWELEVDDAVCALVAGCAAGAPLHTAVRLLAAALDRPAAEVADGVLPAVRDLVGRGFLLPEGPA
jgi:methylase of polypeptide subunit release factors